MIRNLMNNHYTALANVKSTLATREKPRARPKSSQIFRSQQFTQQSCSAFQASPERIRSQIDSCCPQSFVDLRDKLAKNKAAKLGDFHDREHQRNLMALKARMLDVGSRVERKKNVTDPLNNPVRLFRKTDYEISKAGISGYKEAVEKALRQSKQRNSTITQQMLIASKEHSSATRVKKMMMQ